MWFKNLILWLKLSILSLTTWLSSVPAAVVCLYLQLKLFDPQKTKCMKPECDKQPWFELLKPCDEFMFSHFQPSLLSAAFVPSRHPDCTRTSDWCFQMASCYFDRTRSFQSLVIFIKLGMGSMDQILYELWQNFKILLVYKALTEEDRATSLTASFLICLQDLQPLTSCDFLIQIRNLCVICFPYVLLFYSMVLCIIFIYQLFLCPFCLFYVQHSLGACDFFLVIPVRKVLHK